MGMALQLGREALEHLTLHLLRESSEKKDRVLCVYTIQKNTM